MTPITYELASEVSPQLADRIFRKVGEEWAPVAEMPKASFSLGAIDPQRVTFLPHTDELLELYGIILENCRISGIEARKAFADKSDFRLEFQMTVPMDEHSMTIIRRYYKEKLFITCEPMQPQLFDEGQVAPGQIERCEECNEPAQWQDSEKHFWCQKHMRLGKGDIKVIVRLETPKQAEERVMKEKAAERGAETPVEDIKSPVVAEGEFINERNSRKSQSKRVH